MIYPLYVYLRSSVTIIRLLKSIGKTSQMNNSVCVSICIAYMFILHTRSELLVVQKDHALCMERDLPLISLIIVLIGVNLCLVKANLCFAHGHLNVCAVKIFII